MALLEEQRASLQERVGVERDVGDMDGSSDGGRNLVWADAVRLVTHNLARALSSSGSAGDNEDAGEAVGLLTDGSDLGQVGCVHVLLAFSLSL